MEDMKMGMWKIKGRRQEREEEGIGGNRMGIRG